MPIDMANSLQIRRVGKHGTAYYMWPRVYNSQSHTYDITPKELNGGPFDPVRIDHARLIGSGDSPTDQIHIHKFLGRIWGPQVFNAGILIAQVNHPQTPTPQAVYTELVEVMDGTFQVTQDFSPAMPFVNGDYMWLSYVARAYTDAEKQQYPHFGMGGIPVKTRVLYFAMWYTVEPAP